MILFDNYITITNCNTAKQFTLVLIDSNNAYSVIDRIFLKLKLNSTTSIYERFEARA